MIMQKQKQHREWEEGIKYLLCFVSNTTHKAFGSKFWLIKGVECTSRTSTPKYIVVLADRGKLGIVNTAQLTKEMGM